MSEHLLEMAKARVRVKDGKIEVLSDPGISFCPLRRDLYGIEEESRESVERILELHMKEMGMYGPARVLELDEQPVSFGASEILCDGMKEGLVDAAVLVCEGAGSVIVSRPDVLQAVGAHMTGLVQTEPIAEIQKGLAARGSILLDRRASIDQLQAFEKAVAGDYKKIAVTLAGDNANDVAALRKRGGELGVQPKILAVHTSGINDRQAQVLADNCDLVWSCASKAVRDAAREKALLQLGIAIPVFAFTLAGKRLLLNRALHFAGQLVMHRSTLPLAPDARQPRPLI
ncbi:MAG: methanogenesis marker 8 protein [Methanothrix sp.]